MLLFKNKRIWYYILLISVCLYISSFIFFDMPLRDDEGFTMALAHHSIVNLINLDSYDVHPPFYYIVLRIFLLITTFWTRSFFVKLVFARIFSLITFVIGFKYLVKIMDVIKVKINLNFQFFSIIILPSVLSFSSQIRMYSLGMCLIVLEMYEFLLFINFHKTKSLMYACLWILLSSYTHYFAALFSGLLILILFIIYIYKKDLKNALKIFVVGLLLICSYLPWLFYVISHLRTAHHNPGNLIIQLAKCFVSLSGVFSSSLNTMNLLLKLFFIILMYLSMMCCMIWSFKNLNKMFNYFLMINLIVFILILLIGSCADVMFGYEFSVRFIYPSFIIISFIWIVILYKIFCNHKNLFLIMFVPIIIVGIFNIDTSIKCVSTNYFLSCNIIRSSYLVKNSHQKNIYVYIHNKKMPNLLNEQPLESHDSFTTTNKATLFYYLNKNMIPVKHKILFPMSNGDKFGYKVWPNIKKK